ncbi:MAG: hypothetical protein JRI68_04250 [Deltaproteobacteria bacterium]|nr:hypothetical protein [Deltaproteobacteria bacterium]
MSSLTPSPSSTLRTAELDNVRDVLLLEGDDLGKGERIPRTEGPRAVRGTIEGKLAACIADEDLVGERHHSLELARVQFDRGLDLDRAVQLLHRALEIEDDAELREELVRQLSMMGRHVEAGHVLRDGEAQNHNDVVLAWLQSGDAYARAGDAGEAIATYREVAMLAPDDARPFERIACLANWDPDAVPPERAADAILEAAKRYPAGHDGQIVNLLHAFDLAPAYARSAEGLTKLLESQGRHREADEVWREYGTISQHAQEVARSRIGWARQRGDAVAALGAALDVCIVGKPDTEGRETALTEVLRDEDCGAALRAQATDDEPFDSALLAAARTKSGMGRAEAFAKLSKRFSGELRALLLAFASEAYAAAGNGARASRTALEARAVDGRLPRAHAALVAQDPSDDLGPGEIETAAARLPGRSWLVRTMAARLQAEGLHSMALIWARRLIDLLPGAAEPVSELLDRATASEDVVLISAALVSVLETVQPWEDVGAALGRALRALITRDNELAQQLGHTVLEVVGPGSEVLYEAYRELAKAGADPGLDIAVTLRRAASDQIGDDERATLYLDAAELCLTHADAEAAAEHLYCAAAHGGTLDRLTPLLDQVAQAIDQVGEEEHSDAVLAHAHATAWTAEQQGPETAQEAWRKLGALRWDLADDLDGADDALFVACAHDPDGGPYRYAYDLQDRLGAEQAISTIAERAVMVGDEGEDLPLCGKLYAAAARIAAEAELNELAVNAAVAAVQADPSRGDAVAIVEKVATGDEGLIALDFVYNTLADAALGQYGFRAAHYRAARQMERREAYDQALRHAIQAFEAVPSVGASYQMLVRVAAAAGDEGAAVRTLAEVASTLPAEVETVWLLRAAELAKQSDAAQELRFDLLLKAFMLRQNVALAEELGEAAAALTAEAEDGEAVHVRLERAINKALPELSGPRGAATAIALGVLALTVMSDPGLAVRALVRALKLNRRDAEFAPVLPHLDVLCADVVAAHALLEHVNELRANQSVSLSKELKEITSRLYLALSDVPPPSLAPDAVSSVPPDSAPTDSEPADEPPPDWADGIETEVPPLLEGDSTEADDAAGKTARPSDAPMVEAVHEEVELDDTMMEAALASTVDDGAQLTADGEVAEETPPTAGQEQPRDATVAAAVEVLAEEDALEAVEYVEEDDDEGTLVPSVIPPAREVEVVELEQLEPSAPPPEGANEELDDAIEAAEHDAEQAEEAEEERRASSRPAPALDED